jgi:glycosyltransferase involved in cell wall biosynthesis
MEKLSFIVPVYNERANIPFLLKEIAFRTEGTGHPFEVLLVDDGSTDLDTWFIQDLENIFPFLKIIRLPVNSGKESAMIPAFREASGDILIFNDGDLQNSFSVLPVFLEKLKTCHAVFGWRKDRKDPWLKKAISKIANGMRHIVFGFDVHDANCALAAFRRELLTCSIFSYRYPTFWPILFKLHGLQIAEVPIQHNSRMLGQSKYGLCGKDYLGFLKTAILVSRMISLRR